MAGPRNANRSTKRSVIRKDQMEGVQDPAHQKREGLQEENIIFALKKTKLAGPPADGPQLNLHTTCGDFGKCAKLSGTPTQD